MWTWLVGTGPVIMIGLPSSALNLVVPIILVRKDFSNTIFQEFYTSTEENYKLVVDNNHAVTGQWNGELIH